jgi:hypothetical protein
LRTLRDAVRNSLVLVVVQTKDMLTRPWCLAEIFTAIESNVPIVTVAVEGQGNSFDFQAAQALLQASDFRAALEAQNPGAADELERQGLDPAHMGKTIGQVLPYIISKSFNVSASDRVREAQLGDIMTVLTEKIRGSQ